MSSASAGPVSIHAPKRAVRAAAIAAVISFAATGAAHAIEARNATESAAVNARLLQTEMMVAALACDMRPQYNKVVRAFEKDLVRHGKALRQMFQRNHGASAQRRLDQYITQLANDASARSNYDRAAYCRSAGVLFSDVLAVRSGGFDQLTQKLVQEAALPIQSR